jgi:CubicO group peptidase (beta-lactamase class C family)/dienelactone hydrolase
MCLIGLSTNSSLNEAPQDKMTHDLSKMHRLILGKCQTVPETNIMIASNRRKIATLFCFLVSTSATFADDAAERTSTPAATISSDKEIEKLLEPILEKHQVPGLVAGIVKRSGLSAVGAVGLRKTGSPEPITVNDKLHIGSDTKAMTATQIALLVEGSKLSWQSTVADIFPHLKSELHKDFLPVTLEQLLSHRAGIKDDGSFWQVGNGTIVEQRDTLMKRALSKPPAHPPGSRFLYSNFGYIIAGHFVEQATGKSWEEQITSDLFRKLNMTSVGFGFPGTKDKVEEPWGHTLTAGKLSPIQFDNPPVLAPAGRVHLTPADWARFIALHLAGAQGEGKLLSRESFQKLQTPAVGHDYALGWIVAPRDWAGGKMLIHSGSNTFWFATVTLAPNKDVALFAAANLGGPNGQAACDAAITALIGHAGGSTSTSTSQAPADAALNILKTPSGVRFGMLGPKPGAPAPILFVFANEIRETLQNVSYNKIGMLLAPQGFVSVAIDLPCHGENVVPREPQGLDGWAARLKNDKDPIPAVVKDASAVLNYLIAEGYADPSKVTACGTSRGGFSAIHFAAGEPRVRCVAAFAPVTDLLALREFQGMGDHARTNELALGKLADKLAGRPVWMCIGNYDERVDTDRAIAFTREVVKASVEGKKPALIELHVTTSIGHTIHPTAHDEAAVWIAGQLK